MVFDPFVIKNSVVEFVLVGPYRGRDKIFAISENAGLDLKGLAIDRNQDSDDFAPLGIYTSLLLASNRQLNVIESYDVLDIDGEYDDRKSPLRIAWVGYCSSYRRDKIKDLFNRVCGEIRDSILEHEHSNVELSISPVILNCSIANERRQRQRNFMRTALVMYLFIALSVAVVFLLQNYFTW